MSRTEDEGLRTEETIQDRLRRMALDMRRDRPLDWTPEEAIERLAARLEALAARYGA